MFTVHIMPYFIIRVKGVFGKISLTRGRRFDNAGKNIVYYVPMNRKDIRALTSPRLKTSEFYALSYKMRAPKTPRQTAEEAKLMQEIWYGPTPKKETRFMKINHFISELSNPQDVETFSEIVKCLRRDAKKEKKAGLDKPIARLHKDECNLVAGIYSNIANRIEGASVRQKYAICNIIYFFVFANHETASSYTF